MAPDLTELVRIFHASLADVGTFTPVIAAMVPDPYRSLLAHEHHMTVTMEQFHGSMVQLEVLQERHETASYAREIILRSLETERPVQYGIVRIHWAYLPKAARQPIEQHAAPLGRILIEQNVLRQVRLTQLWHIAPSAWLQRVLLPCYVGELYGRTAMLLCDGAPAIELLEIAVLDGTDHAPGADRGPSKPVPSAD